MSNLDLDSLVDHNVTDKAKQHYEDDMEPLLMRAEEVARVLRIGRSKAYQLMASRELPTIRIGRSVRVPAESLDEWIAARVAAENSEKPSSIEE